MWLLRALSLRWLFGHAFRRQPRAPRPAARTPESDLGGVAWGLAFASTAFVVTGLWLWRLGAPPLSWAILIGGEALVVLAIRAAGRRRRGRRRSLEEWRRR